MSVQLNPNTHLAFARPLTTLVKCTLTVTNPNPEPVAFKVKTTAPKQYCVRPNSGRIEPDQTVQVQVLLQPMKEDPPPGTKCKDKFLVQSMTITPALEQLPATDIWNKTEAGDIHEQKIRCIYLENEASPATNSKTAEESDPPEYDTVRSNPYATVKSAAPSSLHPPISNLDNSTSHFETAAYVVPDSTPVKSTPVLTEPAPKSIPVEPKPAVSSVTSSSPTPDVASTPVVSGVPSTPGGDSSRRTASQGSLEQLLAAARTEITSLRGQLSKAESSAATYKSKAEASQVAVVNKKEGLPISTVAMISFIVFLLTWLFM